MNIIRKSESAIFLFLFQHITIANTLKNSRMKKSNTFQSTRIRTLPLLGFILLISFFSRSQCGLISGTQYSGGSSEACACTWTLGFITNCSWGNCSVANQAQCEIDCSGTWFLGSGNAGLVTCSTILPVGLVDFYGHAEGEKIELFWITETETNNDRFDIYHSTNLTDFEFMTSVDGAGNSTEERKYRFIHNDPEVGTHYYKIVQVDFNGTQEETNVISIDYKLNVDTELNFSNPFPNPANEQFFFSFLGSETDRELVVQLISMSGEIVLNKVYNHAYNFMNMNIDITEVPDGMYFVDFTQGSSHEMKRLVVIH